jgi:hypothetical protein
VQAGRLHHEKARHTHTKPVQSRSPDRRANRRLHSASTRAFW